MILRVTEIELFLEKEFEWLRKLIEYRLESHFHADESKYAIDRLTPPKISNTIEYEKFLTKYKFGIEDRVLIIMILASTLKPQVFDVFLIKNEITGIRFSEFGGKIEQDRFIPTYRTAAFILSGNKLPLFMTDFIKAEHPFIKFSILELKSTQLSSILDETMKLSEDINKMILGG